MKNQVLLLAAMLSSLPLSFPACRRTDPVSPAPELTKKVFSLNPGDTLGEMLQDAGLPAAEQNEIVGGLRTVFNPRYCRAGDRFEVALDTAARWTSFKYFTSGLEYYLVEKTTAGVVAQKTAKPATKTIAAAKGTVQTSLWEAMSASGIAPDLIVGFADIFAWQVDFLTETRPGDAYKLIWETYVTGDEQTINGSILGAQYVASGQPHTALLFTDSKGRSDYYTPEGKSLRSAFLKAPLQFRRISSYFSRRRFHPVLKYFRPHLGIDYAAPRGTPVSSLGDGTVIFAGWKGGFGKLVQIRHPNNYVTYYGHLSRFGKGIRPGVKVRQGQVIGNVGSTGLSTGPHLDFRVTKDGRFINFLSIKPPEAASIHASELEEFGKIKKPFFTRLAEIH